MNWSTLRGHAAQIEMFRRSASRQRLSHAYLLAGPGGIGKKRFALTLATCLLCEKLPPEALDSCGECAGCRQMHAGTHPDFFQVGLPAGKSELPISAFLGADDRRGREGLCFELSRRPMQGWRKIAVIDDADHMNTESGNALLKTLEEPPESSLLILVASNPDAMLTTIRSRCQLVRFAPLSLEDTSALLLEQEIVADAQEAEVIASLSEGSLDLAVQLADAELRELRSALYRALATVPFDPVKVTTHMMDGLDKSTSDSAEQRRMAQWLMRFALEFFRRSLLSLTESPAVAVEAPIAEFSARFEAGEPAAIESVMDLLERTSQAASQLEQPIPVSLCLEGYFDDLGYLLRPRAQRAIATPRP